MSIEHLAWSLARIKGSNSNNKNRKDIGVFNKSPDTKRHLQGLSAVHVYLKIVVLGEDNACSEWWT